MEYEHQELNANGDWRKTHYWVMMENRYTSPLFFFSSSSLLHQHNNKFENFSYYSCTMVIYICIFIKASGKRNKERVNSIFEMANVNNNDKITITLDSFSRNEKSFIASTHWKTIRCSAHAHSIRASKLNEKKFFFRNELFSSLTALWVLLIHIWPLFPIAETKIAHTHPHDIYSSHFPRNCVFLLFCLFAFLSISLFLASFRIHMSGIVNGEWQQQVISILIEKCVCAWPRAPGIE